MTARSRGAIESSLPVLATALVGLAGILAAFLAPTWSTKEIERREERREFRAAQRLVGDELGALALTLKSATGVDREVTLAVLATDPFPPPQGQLATPEWTTHKATLAESLPPKVWEAVRDAYYRVRAARPRVTWIGGPDPRKAKDVGNPNVLTGLGRQRRRAEEQAYVAALGKVRAARRVLAQARAISD